MESKPNIYAGTRSLAKPGSGKWIFIDIGFSATSRSCGLLIDGKKPEALTFSDLKDELKNAVVASDEPINLVIEAPLSVAFNSHGNPTGRWFERRGNKTRYWYVSLGCTVLLAATHLLRELNDCVERKQEIRLFEGFVTFKEKSQKSSHINDVLLLRDAVFAPQPKLLDPASQETAYRLESAFLVAGMDFGVPLVVDASDDPD